MNDLKAFTDRFYIGSDSIFNKLMEMQDVYNSGKLPSYPPYNIRKISDKLYSIEIALAGFTKKDIDITLEASVLTVKGNKQDESNNFIYKGISDRAFTRKFTLSEMVEVKNAEFVDGMLKISLEEKTPKNNTKKIEILDSVTNNPQYLVE